MKYLNRSNHVLEESAVRGRQDITWLGLNLRQHRDFLLVTTEVLRFLKHLLKRMVVVFTCVPVMRLGLLERSIMHMHAHALLGPIAASTANLVLLCLDWLIANLPCLDFQLPFLGHRWQEVFCHVTLPVGEHAVSFDLLVAKIHILYIHARVVCVVAESHFQELFSKEVFRAAAVRCVRCRFNNVLKSLISAHVDCGLVGYDIVVSGIVRLVDLRCVTVLALSRRRVRLVLTTYWLS